MVHCFLHLMAIMISWQQHITNPVDLVVCTTWKSALDFHAKAIHSAHCPWCDCISLEEKFVHKSKLEANMSCQKHCVLCQKHCVLCQKQHAHEACMACMYEKHWVLSQKRWVLKWNVTRWHAKSTGCLNRCFQSNAHGEDAVVT